jgi:ferric-dicitrate binding protein FerR (iron transport regulator)
MKTRAFAMLGVLLVPALAGIIPALGLAESDGVSRIPNDGMDPNRDTIGLVDRVERRAEAAFGQRVRQLQQRSPVYFLDLLRTGSDARLSARLDDGSMITMGENAQLSIDEFVYNQGQSREITLRALKGALLFIGEKLFGGDSEVQIRTPVAILGVRGTELWVGPIDGATGVLVLEGEVSVGSAKGVVILGPGEGTMVGDDGTLSPPKTWGEAKVARALEMVSLAD